MAKRGRGAKSRVQLSVLSGAAFSRPIDQAAGNFSDPRIRHAITLVAWADDDYFPAPASTSGALVRSLVRALLATRNHPIVAGLSHCPRFDYHDCENVTSRRRDIIMRKSPLDRHHRILAMTSLSVLAILLTGCADTLEASKVEPRYSSVFLDVTGPDASRVSPYSDMQCVPYARMVSGINLRGDAYTWWNGANGIYQRGAAPAPGAVLVLAQTDRLRSGHVAVVRQVISSREILVDHANWIPGQVINGQSVYDVSPANDWSMPRFFNAEAGVYGSVYPAYGFVYNVAAGAGPAPVASTSSGGQDWVPPQ
jgi:surface antigen